MATFGKIARRGFLLGSLAIAGGVAFGWWKYRTPYGNPLEDGLAEGAATLNPYVIVDRQGVTVITPRAEMGQGVHTTLAALVAEEMDLDLSAVRVIHGPASHAYFNAAMLREGVPFPPTDTGWLAETARNAMEVPAKFLGLQGTGGSSSTPDAFDKMRLAGAAARAVIVKAAAQRLGVAQSELRTERGEVVAPDGQRLPYTALAADLAGVELDAEPVLKPRSEWRLLGRPVPRVDMLGKVTGTATYAIDFRMPEMKFATVKCNPALGGAMNGYDASEAKAMAGVERIVDLPDGVAIVARTTWEAMQAAERVTFDWGPAPYPPSTAEMEAAIAASFTEDRQDSRPRDDGDVDAALAGDVWQAEYRVPYLPHATMEPMTAAALVKDGRLTIWAGTQIPTEARRIGAELAGLPVDSVTVETLLMGGGFGRRLEMDAISQAVRIAVEMPGTPILLTWSREEDMTHDAYRPMAMARVRGRVEGGRVAGFDVATCATSVFESQLGRLGYAIPGPDAAIVQGAWEQPYAFPAYRVTGYRAPMMVPVSSWRSVGNSQNTFFVESAVDELAHLAGVDPLEFRLSQITHDPSRKVIEAVAEMSGWGTAVQGRAKGLAFGISFGVPSAQVIEVEQTDSGIRMTGAWAAVDVGIALDPGIIEQQVSGGMIFGLSAAIRGGMEFDAGRAVQTNFWDQEPLRLRECPPIAVRILENGPRITGIGEPGTPPAAPALANAIFALTGQRIRDLPLSRSVTFA